MVTKELSHAFWLLVKVVMIIFVIRMALYSQKAVGAIDLWPFS